jgi:hypothetical protein
MTPRDIAGLGLKLLGIYAIILSLSKLGRIVVNVGLFHASTRQAAGARFRIHAWAQAIGPVIQLLVGTALFFGGRGLSGVWEKLQGQTATRNRNRDHERH